MMWCMGIIPSEENCKTKKKKKFSSIPTSRETPTTMKENIVLHSRRENYLVGFNKRMYKDNFKK